NTFQRAFEVGRAMGASDQMATAAITFEWLTWAIGKPNANSVLLCKEALGALATDRKALRAKLKSALARALQSLGAADEAAKSAREGIEVARQLKDPTSLCYVLELIFHMIPGPAHIGER